MWKALLNRLKEPSSWVGTAMIASQLTTAIQSKDASAITAVLGGILAIVLPERGTAQPPKQ